MVPEPHHCLTSLLHAEGWTRRHAIVTDKSGRLQAGVDLLSQRLDVDLVVVDFVARSFVRICVERRLVLGKGKRVLEDLLVLGTEPFAIASRSLRGEESCDAQEQ